MKSNLRAHIGKFTQAAKLIADAEKTNEENEQAIRTLNTSLNNITSTTIATTKCTIDPNDLKASLQSIKNSVTNIKKLSSQVLKENIAFLKSVDTPEEMKHLLESIRSGRLSSIILPTTNTDRIIDEIVNHSITAEEANLQSLISNRLHQWDTSGSPSIDSLTGDAKDKAKEKRNELENELHVKATGAINEIKNTLQEITTIIQGMESSPQTVLTELQAIRLDFPLITSLDSEIKTSIRELEDLLKKTKTEGRQKEIEKLLKDLAIAINKNAFTLEMDTKSGRKTDDFPLQARTSGYKLQVNYPRIVEDDTSRATITEVESYDRFLGVDLEDYANSKQSTKGLKNIVDDVKNNTIKISNLRELRTLISTLEGLN